MFLSSVSNYEYSNMSYQVISKLLCLLWDAEQKGDSEDAKLHSILAWHSLTISFKLSRLYLIPGIQQNQHRIIINSFIKTHHLRINSNKVISQCLKVVLVFAKHHKLTFACIIAKESPVTQPGIEQYLLLPHVEPSWLHFSHSPYQNKDDPILLFKRGPTTPSPSSSSLASVCPGNWKQNLKNCSRNFSPTNVGVMQFP